MLDVNLSVSVSQVIFRLFVFQAVVEQIFSPFIQLTVSICYWVLTDLSMPFPETGKYFL